MRQALEGTSGGKIERCPECGQLCRVLPGEGLRPADGVRVGNGAGPGGGEGGLQPNLRRPHAGQVG